ncbi:MAG: DUF4387 domain-containing protein [Bacillota bacterium]
MARLVDVAKVLRAKNAGPFQETFDIMFDDKKLYETVRDSGTLDQSLIAKLYRVGKEHVRIVPYDAASAIKITIPRRCSSGSADDTDVYGAQQYALLINLEIPS